MFSLASSWRHKLSFWDLKHVATLIEKNHAYNLTNFQHLNFRNLNCLCQCRIQKYCTDNKKKDLAVSGTSPGYVSTPKFETVKENTKTAWYGSIVVIGLGVTAIVFYTLFSELFSSNSPNSIYSRTLNRCIQDEKVIFSLGEPIKGCGELNSRGRRRHVSHLLYEKDGVSYIRMKFYIKGCRRNGTVHLEMRQNDKGKYEYRYLFVQLDEYPYTTIVLEDNRSQMASTPLPQLDSYSDDFLKNS